MPGGDIGFAFQPREISIDLLGSLAGLPRTCQENYTRIQSRIFRLSYVTITNLKMWNSTVRSR